MSIPACSQIYLGIHAEEFIPHPSPPLIQKSNQTPQQTIHYAIYQQTPKQWAERATKSPTKHLLTF